jgi:hypothetical protein
MTTFKVMFKRVEHYVVQVDADDTASAKRKATRLIRRAERDHLSTRDFERSFLCHDDMEWEQTEEEGKR